MKSDGVTLFLCGDVMTGRGIDQILPHPSKPHLYEPYMRSALGYVALAEKVPPPIPRPVDYAYVWGDALAELANAKPHARIVNLETAVTTSEDAWPDKGIHYRMHPANLPCLSVARIDCCVLANNHVLDWGYAGLNETLDALAGAGLRTAGAGRNADEAARPAVIDLPDERRVLTFAFGSESAGVSPQWAASPTRAGVNYLRDFSKASAEQALRQVSTVKRPGDIAVVSIHWGSNWGYAISSAQRAFAHRLVDSGAVDLVHGHSSHHPIGIEVRRGRLILYGCGDFLNDYEGIGGYEAFRSDLTVMYLPTLDGATGRLTRLILVPMRIRGFRLNRAGAEELDWLQRTLDREGRKLGTRITRAEAGRLLLKWS
jgi:poly-gamma-glutamate synthesis protein (capsule biosynthesis protein)